MNNNYNCVGSTSLSRRKFVFIAKFTNISPIMYNVYK